MRPNAAYTSAAVKAGTSAASNYATNDAGSALDSPEPNKPRK